MKQIAEGLWQSSQRDVSSVSSEQFDVVFWMCGGPISVPFGVELVDFAIPDDPNGCAPELFDRLRRLAAAHAHLRVLTVCSMGENRSGLMSALILVARGMEPEDAVRRVQEKGPHNSPDRPHSFWNPGFVKQVLSMKR